MMTFFGWVALIVMVMTAVAGFATIYRALK
jgi:hypothetical protein